MSSDSEGLAIAPARIAAEQESRTGFLDLGRLDLWALPEALFALEHLWGLNLGDLWLDDQRSWHSAEAKLNANRVASQLADLRRFPGLRLLSLSSIEISDLSPLSALTGLQSLHCSYTKVSDLSPLSALTGLQFLSCRNTQVSDLSPLAQLGDLRRLDCSSASVGALPDGVVWRPSLQQMYLFNPRISKIPPEVLSRGYQDNCLERIRSHFRDLQAGDEILPDVKVLVLGNGRIGKTQICRRLRGETFEQNAESTHGIRLTTAELSLAQATAKAGRPQRKKDRGTQSAANGAILHLWDFGGQDLYHGTHALFMRTRSIFIVVWTPQSEDTRQYEHDGVTFYNHPLSYWVELIRHLSGLDSPVLIVQNMCERPEHEVMKPPVQAETLQS